MYNDDYAPVCEIVEDNRAEICGKGYETQQTCKQARWRAKFEIQVVASFRISNAPIIKTLYSG